MRIAPRHGIFFGIILVVLGSLLAAVAAGENRPPQTTALTNWLVALNTFRHAGALVGENKLTDARRELAAASTNLPSPFAAMAAQIAAKIAAASAVGTNSVGAGELRTRIKWCAQLHSYDAALRLQSASMPADELEDDSTYAWRLFESGNLSAALAEYKRRLAGEMVENFRQNYQDQARLAEQRAANLTNATYSLRLVQQHYLRGLEEKADPLGAVTELYRVLPHARDAREAVAVQEEIIRCLARLNDEDGRDAWEDKLMRDFPSDAEACANVLLERGLRFYNAGDYARALSLLQKVCTQFPNSGSYGDAQYAVGLILHKQGKYTEALAEYQKIFDSKVNDQLIDTEKSDDYKNYRHRTALRMSECYEAGQDFARALSYAEMARDRYPYLSYCKNCMRETREALEKRIEMLRQKVSPAKSAAKAD